MKNNNNNATLTYGDEEEIFMPYTNPSKQDQLTKLQDSFSVLKQSIKSLGTGKPNVYKKMLSEVRVLQSEITKLEEEIKKDEFSKAQNKILKPYIQSEVQKENSDDGSMKNNNDNVTELDYKDFSSLTYDGEEEIFVPYTNPSKQDQITAFQDAILALERSKKYLGTGKTDVKTKMQSRIDDLGTLNFQMRHK